MVIKNLKIVTENVIIENAYIDFDSHINKIGVNYKDDSALDGAGFILMPGFIDVHIHGSMGIDFMDAEVPDYTTIANSLYKEGVTSFLATTLTSDHESMLNVCRKVKEAKKNVPSLLGIHFEGPYINSKYKGAQNEKFIRKASIEELDAYIEASGNNVRYITLAPEVSGTMDFISYASSKGITLSAGHSDASFDDITLAITKGLTNTTHTHNAMSPHHHRNPGIVSAAMYYDSLYPELIADTIHVCKNTIKTFYKIVGSDRLIIITDALKGKHSSLDKFELFGLPVIKRDGAAYLESGPLAGSLLSMDQGLRNIRDTIENISLIDLAKITSRNAAKSLHVDSRIGSIKEGLEADFVLLNNNLEVVSTYKGGRKVK